MRHLTVASHAETDADSLGEEQLEKLDEVEKAETAKNRKREQADSRKRGRGEHVLGHILASATTDKACLEVETYAWHTLSLLLSGSKSLATFRFHFRRLPSLRLAFNEARKNRTFDYIQCQRGRESSCKGKREKAKK